MLNPWTKHSYKEWVRFFFGSGYLSNGVSTVCSHYSCEYCYTVYFEQIRVLEDKNWEGKDAPNLNRRRPKLVDGEYWIDYGDRCSEEAFCPMQQRMDNQEYERIFGSW